VEFTKWWIAEFKTVKFPAQGTLFDYYIDSDTKKFEPWTKRIPKFEFDYELPLQVGALNAAADDRTTPVAAAKRQIKFSCHKSLLPSS
jgi:dynein heavy chain, axonemal